MTHIFPHTNFKIHFTTGSMFNNVRKSFPLKTFLRSFSTDTMFVSSGSNPITGAINPSIEFSTTYERDENGNLRDGYYYSRINNPTRNQFEKLFTTLEGGQQSYAFSSGMQAATSILLSSPGSYVLLPDDLYHGVSMIAKDVFEPWGMKYEKIDMTKTSLVISKIQDALTYQKSRNSMKPIIVWIEMPSNPLTKIADLELISSFCRRSLNPQQILLVIDSTWCSPYLLSPLKQFQFDIVFHSITKYITGHSDVLGGIVTVSNHFTTNHPTCHQSLQTVQQICGGVCGPWESWMAMRGLRTLPVRMKQHCKSAMKLATRLEGHQCVERVYYPGLKSHPQHDLATKQMKSGLYGGMMSILVKSKGLSSLGDGGQVEALQVVKAVRLFKRATSLGGTESLIEHRRSIEGSVAISPPNLLRISVGLEDIEDLYNDLNQALLSTLSL